jgi:hypothetical protein
MKNYKSGFTEEQRKAIRSHLIAFTNEHASRLGCPPEAVVQEVRYWQQTNRDWPTNPRKAHKLKSFEYYKGNCWVCDGPIGSIDDATFHHLERGVSNLHSPENMVLLHKKTGCHERLHNAPAGSPGWRAKPLSRMRGARQCRWTMCFDAFFPCCLTFDSNLF